MAWPTMSDYQEVIQNPKSCFQDGQLKAGAPTLNPLGLPQPITGGFASVYQMTTGRTRWAVRCFLHNIADLQERYSLISRYLQSKSLRYMVAFEYLREGIRVRGAFYPILKMEWVDGDTLSFWVEKNVRSSKTLRKAADRWIDLVAALERSGISHCDMQHGNILVNGGDFRLIDYDGMYVPLLQGRGSHEKGHPAYQHPQREGRNFDETIDRFSAIVIYLSLAALAEFPDLWARFYEEDNLIFRRSDFMNPDVAPVFDALEQIGDKHISEIAEALRDCCKRPLSDVPRLKDVLAGKVGAPAPAGRVTQAPFPPPQPAVRSAPAPVTVATAPAPPPRTTGPAAPPPAPRVTAPAAPPPRVPSTMPGWMNESSRQATAPAAAGWQVEWLRPGQMKEKHVYRVPVYAKRSETRRLLGIPLGHRTNKVIERYEEKVQERNSTVDGHRGEVTALAFTHDGKLLVTGSADRTLRVWQAASGRDACPPLEAGARVVTLAFVPERSVIAAALDDRRLILWDFGLHRQVIHLETPDRSRLKAVAVSGDARAVVAGGDGRTFFLWNTDRGDLGGIYKQVSGRVNALAFTPDGNGVLVATHNGRLDLFDRGTFKVRWSVRTGLGRIAAMAAPPRGSGVVCGAEDGTVAFYDVRDGRELKRLRPHWSRIRSLAVSPEGVLLLVGLASGVARMSAVGSEKELAALAGHDAPVTAVALPSGGKCAATGTREGVVRYWVLH